LRAGLVVTSTGTQYRVLARPQTSDLRPDLSSENHARRFVVAQKGGILSLEHAFSKFHFYVIPIDVVFYPLESLNTIDTYI
jgi:hypothetical protein